MKTMSLSGEGNLYPEEGSIICPNQGRNKQNYNTPNAVRL